MAEYLCSQDTSF
ncbi:hypothetical protein NGA_0199500 [Nannochloropsis gaditana CCMP526]|nr:hypothetical protein NGA_0199500 [Nannochloropsis gaditana CCMP526]EKU21690.1 hypothetical protein NGA_0199500 [Nannochloropsis gaditana CCMP526]|eukprot:XP_005854673.1 hypothetical protein NGA_0199500 [Nannochloropsis gaditana CCMP526]